jgi:release factor glutamine methyltransferase
MLRSIQTILTQDQSSLERSLDLDTSASRIEVQCLLQQALGVARAYLFAHPERVLSNAESATYEVIFQRRLGGEPIAYILGEREFYGLKFKVTPDTLIPRPETELLVELALERIPTSYPSFPLPQSAPSQALPRWEREAKLPLPSGEGWGGGAFHVLDLGTGSGAIALAIAHQRPNVKVWACDFSASALTVARANAEHLAINNVEFVESNWYSAFTGQHFDIIVSNPPYIAIDDQHLSQGDVRFEPSTALVGGKDGLDDIRQIILQASAYLNPAGWLMLEHGYDQAPSVRELMQKTGFESVFSARDISGIDRCSGGQFNK